MLTCRPVDIWIQSDVSIHETGRDFADENIMLKMYFGPEEPFVGAPYADARLTRVEVIYEELSFSRDAADPLGTPRTSDDGTRKMHAARKPSNAR